jgi:hypothetical protein
MTITAQDREHAVVFRCPSSDPQTPFLEELRMGHPSAILIDGRENVWVGVVPYLQYDAAIAAGCLPPRDFDKAYELLFPSHASGFASKRPEDGGAGVCEADAYTSPNRLFRWIPVSDVKEVVPVLRSEKAAFRALLKAKQVSKRSMFVRPVERDFDSEGGDSEGEAEGRGGYY